MCVRTWETQTWNCFLKTPAFYRINPPLRFTELNPSRFISPIRLYAHFGVAQRVTGGCAALTGHWQDGDCTARWAYAQSPFPWAIRGKRYLISRQVLRISFALRWPFSVYYITNTVMLGTCWGNYKEPKSFKTVHLGFTVVYLLSIAYAEKKYRFQ